MGEGSGVRVISKVDIFYYIYAVLHNPEYRKKYELNLKREFPRIPFYDDFFKWVNWGKQLMELHLNYETIKPYPLIIVNQSNSVIARRQTNFKKSIIPNSNLAVCDSKSERTAISDHGEIASGGLNVQSHNLSSENPPRNDSIKVKLKADKIKGEIILDDITTLTGIPAEAWEYKLGNRSALEWILDQYKEKKPKDPTIAERFNTYRFADYKETVIDLLMRVTTVSVETMKIIKVMN
jgi:predicted helicase